MFSYLSYDLTHFNSHFQINWSKINCSRNIVLTFLAHPVYKINVVLRHLSFSVNISLLIRDEKNSFNAELFSFFYFVWSILSFCEFKTKYWTKHASLSGNLSCRCLVCGVGWLIGLIVEAGTSDLETAPTLLRGGGGDRVWPNHFAAQPLSLRFNEFKSTQTSFFMRFAQLTSTLLNNLITSFGSWCSNEMQDPILLLAQKLLISRLFSFASA